MIDERLPFPTAHVPFRIEAVSNGASVIVRDRAGLPVERHAIQRKGVSVSIRLAEGNRMVVQTGVVRVSHPDVAVIAAMFESGQLERFGVVFDRKEKARDS